MPEIDALSVFSIVADSKAMAQLNDALKEIDKSLKLVWDAGIEIETIWGDPEEKPSDFSWSIESQTTTRINENGDVIGSSSSPVSFGGSFTLFYGVVPIGSVIINDLPMVLTELNRDEWIGNASAIIQHCKMLLDNALKHFSPHEIKLQGPGVMQMDIRCGKEEDRFNFLLKPGTYSIIDTSAKEGKGPDEKVKTKRKPRKEKNGNSPDPEDEEIRKMIFEKASEE